MGFFRKMFGQETSAEQTITPIVQATVKPAGIGYDPALIKKLLNHHAQLGSLFERIGGYAQAGDYDKVRGMLAKFKASLDGHVLTENVRFYAYLQQSMASDTTNAETIHSFRKEMNTIARQVGEFVDKWKTNSFNSSTQQRQFREDYERVGKLLEQRLNNEEETLYPLYQQY